MSEITKAAKRALNRYMWLEVARSTMGLVAVLGETNRRRISDQLEKGLQQVRSELYNLQLSASKDALLMALYSPNGVRKPLLAQLGSFVAAPNCSISHLISTTGSYESWGNDGALKQELSDAFKKIVGSDPVAPEHFRSTDKSVEIVGSHSMLALAGAALFSAYVTELEEILRQHQMMDRSLPPHLEAAFQSIRASLAPMEASMLYESVASGSLRATTLPMIAEMADALYSKFMPLTTDEQLKPFEERLRKEVLTRVGSATRSYLM